MGLFNRNRNNNNGDDNNNVNDYDDLSQYGYFASFMVQRDALMSSINKARERQTSKQLELSKAGMDSTGDCSGNINCASSEFFDLFEAELNRVTETISSQQQSQELSAKALLTNVDALVNNNNNNNDNDFMNDTSINSSTGSTSDPETTIFTKLRRKGEDIATIGLQLQRFVARNAIIFREIANYADEVLGENLATTTILSRRLHVAPWKEGPNTALVVVLSDIYDTIRKAELQDQKQSGKWVAPSSFERSTTKYWIAQDHLTDLLLTAVKEAPLLVYGRSGHLTSKSDLTNTEGNKLWDSLATPISSVYFDSPTMSMYRERIKRSEGAQLFRVRWYGAKPQGDEVVFLELKTHHEKWINEKSVKERCVIREKDMRIFLSSKNWTVDVAREIVLSGTPTINTEQLEKQIELCCRMHDVVINNNLRPCVRSLYVRAAFQSSDSNDLRLTLDRNVTLIDESRAPRGSWCLPDNAVIETNMVSRVPYPVFEVKLSGTDAMPASMQQLVDNGIMIEAPKFSKFLSGAAAFNTHKIEVLPYWADDEAFDGFFTKNMKQPIPSSSSEQQQDKQQNPKEAQDDNNNNEESLGDKIRNRMEAFTVRKSMSMKRLSYRVTNPSIGNSVGFDRVSEMFIIPDDDDDSNSETDNMDVSALGKSARSTTSELGKSGKSTATATRTAPVVASFNINDNVSKTTAVATASSIPAAGNSNNNNNGIRKRNTGGGNNNNNNNNNNNSGSSSGKPPLPVRPKRPARVEPKSYFANERTFIQWVSAALLLVTVSVILLDFQADSGVPTTAGIILNAVAVFVVIYSIFAYYKRLQMLQTGSPYGYVDHAGPIVLSTSVLLGIVILLYYYADYAIKRNREIAIDLNKDDDSDGIPPIISEAGMCFQRPISSASSSSSLDLLQYEPSDIVVDEKHNLLLVPSLQSITAFNTAWPNTPVETLITKTNADFEAITIVNDRIFAISEGDDTPILVEYKWNNSTTTNTTTSEEIMNHNNGLSEVRSWKLKTRQKPMNGRAEGLTYVPNINGNDDGIGKLYLAGDSYDPALAPDKSTRGAIYIFDVPPPTTEENDDKDDKDYEKSLERVGQLNANLLNSNLKDSKISALQYFEEKLYIMNDNARVIRSWDIHTGTLLATYRLPHIVQSGFSRQWEGMAFQRIITTASNVNVNNNRRSLLRGGERKKHNSSNRKMQEEQQEELVSKINSSSLLLHLALDTPPQLWTFQMMEEVVQHNTTNANANNNNEDGISDGEEEVVVENNKEQAANYHYTMRFPQCSGVSNL